MFYALSWFFVLLLLALWSLTAWAVQGVAAWAVGNAGALTGAAANAGAIRLPDWMAAWLPPEVAASVVQLLASLGPVVESLVQSMPALAGGVTVLAWIVWAVGSVLLLLLGAGLHGLIALWRRRNRGGPGGPGQGPSAAARSQPGAIAETA